MIITTTKGEMDDALLERRDGTDEDVDAVTEWVEYWLAGELVHRSAHVTLKHGIAGLSQLGGLG